MNLLNTMICFNRGGPVCLVPWPDSANRSGRFEMTVGACFADVRRMNFKQRQTYAFISAVQMVVAYGCAPAEVHEVFLDLDEYIDGLASDIPGVAERRYRST